MEHTIERTAEEVAEIERHKYFLSEKAGYDVGRELAEQDWDSNHAAAFRGGDTSQGGAGISLLFKRLFSRKDG